MLRLKLCFLRLLLSSCWKSAPCFFQISTRYGKPLTHQLRKFPLLYCPCRLTDCDKAVWMCKKSIRNNLVQAATLVKECSHSCFHYKKIVVSWEIFKNIVFLNMQRCQYRLTFVMLLYYSCGMLVIIFNFKKGSIMELREAARNYGLKEEIINRLNGKN